MKMLETLLEIPLFEVQHRAEVRAALMHYARGTVDFADHLISHLGRSAGCRDVLTSDARWSEDLGFARLDRPQPGSLRRRPNPVPGRFRGGRLVSR